MRLRDRVADGIAWQGGGQAVGILSGLAKLTLIARVVPAEEIGVYALALVAVSVASQLGGLGVGKALYRYPASTRKTLRHLLLITLGASILIGIAGGAIVTELVDAQRGACALALAIAIAAATAGQAVTGLSSVLLSLRLAFATVARVSLFGRLATDAAVVAAVLYRPDALGVVAGLGVGSVLGACVAAGAAFGANHPATGSRSPPAHLAAILRYGGLSLGEEFIGVIVSRVDRLVISSAYGLEALGIYEIVLQFVVRPYEFFAAALESIYAPLYTRYLGRAGALRTIHRDYFASVGLLLVPATAFAVAFGGPLLALVAGSPYDEYGAVFAALALLRLYSATGLPVYQYINAAGHIRLSIKVNLLYGLVRVGALLAASHWLGLTEAFCLYVAAQLTVVAVVERRLRRRFFGMDLLTSFRPLLTPALTSTVSVLLAYLGYALTYASAPIAALWVGLTVYAAAYFVVNRQALRSAVTLLFRPR